MDGGVLDAVSELGYIDFTATAARPSFLPAGSPRAALDAPAWIRLDDGRRVFEVPSTHSLGEAARALAGALPPVVHVHFHDYELLETRRRTALSALLRLLARRRKPVAPDAVAADREVAWASVCAD